MHTEFDLFIAVSKNDLDAVRRMLYNDINVNAISKNYNGFLDGMTPLIVAAQYGHIECVKLLVENGADIEMRTDDFDNVGMTPLMFTAFRGQLDVLEYLISCNAKINEISTVGRSALSYVCHSMPPTAADVAKTLIRNGATIDVVDAKLFTPLLHSVSSHIDCVDVIRILLDADANRYYKHPTHGTIDDYAKSLNYRHVTGFLKAYDEEIQLNQTISRADKTHSDQIAF